MKLAVWHLCNSVLNQALSKRKNTKAALQMVFNVYKTDYNQLLSMSKRSPLLIVRPMLRALLIEIF